MVGYLDSAKFAYNIKDRSERDIAYNHNKFYVFYSTVIHLITSAKTGLYIFVSLMM